MRTIRFFPVEAFLHQIRRISGDLFVGRRHAVDAFANIQIAGYVVITEQFDFTADRKIEMPPDRNRQFVVMRKDKVEFAFFDKIVHGVETAVFFEREKIRLGLSSCPQCFEESLLPFSSMFP